MQKAPFPAGSRVLIVEDEFLVAMDLEDRLKRQGCGVIGPAPRETKALALLEQVRPDAVVLDLNLDGKLPIDLANTLVARQIPFVIVSGYGNRHPDVPALLAARRCISRSERKSSSTRLLSLSRVPTDRLRQESLQAPAPKKLAKCQDVTMYGGSQHLVRPVWIPQRYAK
jgi:DNA-binding NarL/FixJ family response regulator